MTNIIELAKEAGFDDLFIKYGDLCLERFAALVRAELLKELAELTEKNGNIILAEQFRNYK